MYPYVMSYNTDVLGKMWFSSHIKKIILFSCTKIERRGILLSLSNETPLLPQSNIIFTLMFVYIDLHSLCPQTLFDLTIPCEYLG